MARVRGVVGSTVKPCPEPGSLFMAPGGAMYIVATVPGPSGTEFVAVNLETGNVYKCPTALPQNAVSGLWPFSGHLTIYSEDE